MVTEIKKNEYGFLHSVFFEQNLAAYNMMLEIMKKEHRVFVSDTPKMVAVLSDGMSLWVCVEDGLTNAECNLLLSGLLEKTARFPVETFASSPRTASALRKLYRPANFYLQEKLAAYICYEAKPDSIIRGRFRKAGAADRAVTNQMTGLFMMEFYGLKNTGRVNGREDAKDCLIKDNGNENYIWQHNGVIVAMASVTCRAHRKARINNVYVDNAYRNMGYGTMLVSHLSRTLLNEGFVPVLYSKETDIYANKMYVNAGFEKCGAIDVYAAEDK